MKKRTQVKEIEENQVNIRAIRNREQRKTTGKIADKAKKMEKHYKNIHADIYGESDDTDDEKVLSKIGRLQTKHYKDKDFIGYDENLNKIVKKQQFEDKIQEFLEKSENKDWWRVVRDELNNQDIILNDQQLHVLDRIRSGKSAKPMLPSEYFEYDHDINNLLQPKKPKRRFTPSKWERIKVNKLVQGIKLGHVKLWEEPKEIDHLYDIWADDKQTDEMNKYLPPRIPAPKAALPTNAYSYNPPQEYLFTKEEEEAWFKEDPEDRELPFVPQQFRYLRQVPASQLLTRDAFNRCLDLYLCPRVRRQKLQMKSSDFLVNLPDPQELKPFPTKISAIIQNPLENVGNPININISHDGTTLAVCFQMAIVLFDTRTTRAVWNLQGGIFYGVYFNSLGQFCILRENGIEIYSLNTNTQWTEIIQKGKISQTRAQPSESYKWNFQSEEGLFGLQLRIELKSQPTFLSFHSKSDYMVSTQPSSEKRSECILVHCVSKAQTQVAFNRLKASTEIQQTHFHPTQPHLLIMTKKHVFIYSLSKQTLVKKLLTGNQWNCSLDSHISGDHILLGSQDRKVCWFDLDMGATPYKKLQYHENGVNKVCFHNSYPLFASASDDSIFNKQILQQDTINIFHGKVSSDLTQQALILPLKVLKAEKKSEQYPVKDIIFHPIQPWIYSINSNGLIYYWT